MILSSSSLMASTTIVSLPWNSPLQQFLGQRIFDAVLDRATQRTSTVVEVRALLDQELLGVVGQLEAQAAFEQSLADLAPVPGR